MDKVRNQNAAGDLAGLLADQKRENATVT